MKLYVWEESYDIKWGGNVVFSVADNEEEARQLVLKKRPQAVLNKPTFVQDVPCSSFYEWQE